MKKEFDDKLLFDRIRGGFVGAYVGDSFGAPWEMMEYKRLLALTRGCGVRSYEDVPLDLFKNHPHVDFRTMKVGDYTDDYAFTSSNARAIIKVRKIDPVEIARQMVATAPHVHGMGRATIEAIESFDTWFISEGKFGRNPNEPAKRVPGAGGGNGVAMRVSPLAIFLTVTQPEDALGFRRALHNHGAMTHGDPRASHAGVAVGQVFRQVLFEENVVDFPKQSLRENFLSKVIVTLQDAEREFPPPFEERVTMYDQVVRLIELSVLNSKETLEAQLGTKCEAVYSVPFSIGLFLMYPTDIANALFASVNCGRFSEKPDRDTIASMVGAMVGLNIGYEKLCTQIPHLVNFRPEIISEIIALSDEFCRVCIEESK